MHLGRCVWVYPFRFGLRLMPCNRRPQPLPSRRGRIGKFSLDALANLLARVGRQVAAKVKKAA
jgi:hypothetical protein